ncbi:MAG: HAD hydrolase-like protein [Solirubrobacteraceae bacterium]
MSTEFLMRAARAVILDFNGGDYTRYTGLPDKAMSFIAALAKINGDRPQAIAAEDTVVIEDATDGVRAARAAGMRCVALRGRAYDEDSGLAELVVDRLTAELARTLLQAES